MFSKSTEYALRAVMYLSQNSSKEHKISIEELSLAIDSPKSFTSKILQKLTKDQVLVHSVTGPGGGFYLTADSRKKSVYGVLEIMEEDTVLSKCVLGLHVCSDLHPCPMHSTYKNIKPKLLAMFKNKSIEQLANELEKKHIVLKNK